MQPKMEPSIRRRLWRMLQIVMPQKRKLRKKRKPRKRLRRKLKRSNKNSRHQRPKIKLRSYRAVMKTKIKKVMKKTGHIILEKEMKGD